LHSSLQTLPQHHASIPASSPLQSLHSLIPHPISNFHIPLAMDSQPPALPGSPPQQEQQQQQQQQSQPQQHASPTQNLLQGDIAAQEAAAREWAPQLEVGETVGPCPALVVVVFDR
jgi:hypothetical protein